MRGSAAFSPPPPKKSISIKPRVLRFSLPGPVNSECSLGCHRLIQDGAGLVQNVDDVIHVRVRNLTPLLPRRGLPGSHDYR